MSKAAWSVLRGLTGCVKCGGRCNLGYVVCGRCWNYSHNDCRYCGASVKKGCEHLLYRFPGIRSPKPFVEYTAPRFQDLRDWMRCKYPVRLRVWFPKLEPDHWQEAMTLLPPDIQLRDGLPAPLLTGMGPYSVCQLLDILEIRGEVVRKMRMGYGAPCADWARDPEKTVKDLLDACDQVWRFCLEVEHRAGGTLIDWDPGGFGAWFWPPMLPSSPAFER